MLVPGQPADLLTESNLSATVFALEALRAAGTTDEGAFAKALVFVRRCQNYTDGLGSAFDDGGFFFMSEGDWRNKAGPLGTDEAGRRRYASYGSMTADGLRAHARGQLLLPSFHSIVIALETTQGLRGGLSSATRSIRLSSGRAEARFKHS